MADRAYYIPPLCVDTNAVVLAEEQRMIRQALREFARQLCRIPCDAALQGTLVHPSEIRWLNNRK